MKNTAYAENRYILSSILMEALKYAFGVNLRGYAYRKHKFYDAAGSFKDFRTILAEIYAEFGITKADRDFVDFRNEVIHEGKSSLSFPDLVGKQEHLERTIEHLLLKILGYQGQYWDSEGRRWVEFSTLTV